MKVGSSGKFFSRDTNNKFVLLIIKLVDAVGDSQKKNFTTLLFSSGFFSRKSSRLSSVGSTSITIVLGRSRSFFLFVIPHLFLSSEFEI